MRLLLLIGSLFSAACVLDTSGLDFSGVSTGGTTVSASGGAASTGGASVSTGDTVGTGGAPVPRRVCDLALPQCLDCDQLPTVLAGCVGVSGCWQVVDVCGVRCKEEKACQ